MPKKTKKEKIIADYRRKLSAVSGHVHVSPVTNVQMSSKEARTSTPSYTVPAVSQNNTSADTMGINPEEFIAIKKDLFITLALAGCVFIGQIILWRIVG